MPQSEFLYEVRIDSCVVIVVSLFRDLIMALFKQRSWLYNATSPYSCRSYCMPLVEIRP